MRANSRASAALVGALFINAIVFLFVGEALYRPFLAPGSPLVDLAAHQDTFIVGVLVEWIASVPMILAIPILLYPVLANVDARLAAGYLAFRLFEVALLTLAAAGKLSLLSLGAGVADATIPQSLATAFAANTQAWVSLIDTAGLFYLLVFGTGALFLFFALYKGRIVPRAIAGFGLIAITILILSAIWGAFTPIPEAVAPIVWGPTAVAEIVLSLWLIAVGFNTEVS